MVNRQARRERILGKLKEKKRKAKPEKKPEPKPEPVPEPITPGGMTLLEAIQELDSEQPLAVLKRRYLKRKAKENEQTEENV